jgi:uncharacterized repeat protein (TIGR03943 family)
VNRLTQSVIVSVVGLVSGLATVNGLFLNFVKPTLQWPLLVASAVLVAIGVYGALVESADDTPAEARTPQRGDEPGHTDQDVSIDQVSRDAVAPGSSGAAEPLPHHEFVTQTPHTHAGGPRIAWLLVVPFVLMGVAAPPPLGAFSAQQDSGLVTTVDSAYDGIPPLPASSAPVALTLSEYSARAVYDQNKTLQGRTVRLTGFVSGRKGGQGWVLTRIALSCCAADAYAVKVDVKGGQRLPDNTWLDVIGSWVPTPGSADTDNPGLPIVRIQTMTQVPMPRNPYE